MSPDKVLFSDPHEIVEDDGLYRWVCAWCGERGGVCLRERDARSGVASHARVQHPDQYEQFVEDAGIDR